MAPANDTDHLSSAGKGMEGLEYPRLLKMSISMENVSFGKTVQQFINNLNIYLPCNLAILFLDICMGEMYKSTQRLVHE